MFLGSTSYLQSLSYEFTLINNVTLLILGLKAFPGECIDQRYDSHVDGLDKRRSGSSTWPPCSFHSPENVANQELSTLLCTNRMAIKHSLRDRDLVSGMGGGGRGEGEQ